MVRNNLLFVFFIYALSCSSQLKFILDDLEGLSDGTNDLTANGIFAYGNISCEIKKHPNRVYYLDDRYISVKKNGDKDFGGWGKGIGLFVDLDVNSDYLNFFISSNENFSGKIQLQEDDNTTGKFEAESDDVWAYEFHSDKKDSTKWHLVSIPLNSFKDANSGGDGIFNCNYKQGKLLCFILSMDKTGSNADFDLLCFSKGPFTPNNQITTKCALGFWSKEDDSSEPLRIPLAFYDLYGKGDYLSVIHFFHPFSISPGHDQHLFPPIDKINKLIQKGYIPMITLEDHYINAFTKQPDKSNQPNLYSIVEGHFDDFFRKWAKDIKQVKGTVLLRIFHEFNGDWYPWCIANNDRNSELLVKAYRHIHDLFKQEAANNVKFIWCPNSMSVPQESWNFILDAYPGDEYVDCVGLDIYNGTSEKNSIWRSFKKEGIENYFVITQNFPDKPFLVCETASRERNHSEDKNSQTKADWIRQQSEALRSDMNAVQLMAWFNEKGTFILNSSEESRKAYSDFILKDGHFGDKPAFIKESGK
jgi:hypothetical protein